MMIRMRWAHLDRVDHFYKIHSVAFRKEAPFVEERQYGRSKAVFDYFRGFRFHGSFQDRERMVYSINHFAQEFDHSAGRFRIYAAANPPEIPDGSDIIRAGHNSFIAVGDCRLRFNAALLESPFNERVSYLFRGAGGHRSLDQDQSVGLNGFTDYFECLFEFLHLHVSRATCR